MSGEWPLRRLTDVVSLPKGQVSPLQAPYKSQVLLAPDHMESGTGEIRKRETAESQGAVSGKYVVRPGDVVFSKIRPALRKVALADFTGICSADMYPLRPGVDVIGGFVKAVLLGEDFSRYVESLSGRTGIPKVNRGDLAGFWFPVPPVEEQQRIIEVIGSVTELERGIEASIAKFHKLRKGSLLASMKSVESAQPAAGWARVPLKSVVPSAEYGISEALEGDARGVPVLRMNNIQGARFDADDLRYCPVPVPSKLFLRRGDVLFNRTNSMEHIGKAAMWRDELPSATFASYLVRLVPDLQRVTPEYLVEWLMHPLVRQRVRSISTVAVQQVNVNPTRLRELEIDLPVDLAEQRRIVATLEACDEQIGREEEELQKLRELKQGLVGDLLSGRVTTSGVVA